MAVLINAVNTSNPPLILEIDRKRPLGVEAAVNEEITSGAPLPNANKVTPASVSDILSFCEMY